MRRVYLAGGFSEISGQAANDFLVDLISIVGFTFSMAILDIVCLPDPLLRQKSKLVEQLDERVARLMDDMLATMYQAPGIGLAAIQVGAPLRVITIDITAQEDGAETEPLLLINPVIDNYSADTKTYNEGCLSIPDYYAEVERPDIIELSYLDRQGIHQSMRADGLLSVCIQHEVDHLDGILFIDHLSRMKREMVIRKFKKAAKAKSTKL